jgi:hypothetical protein
MLLLVFQAVFTCGPMLLTSIFIQGIFSFELYMSLPSLEKVGSLQVFPFIFLIFEMPELVTSHSMASGNDSFIPSVSLTRAYDDVKNTE